MRKVDFNAILANWKEPTEAEIAQEAAFKREQAVFARKSAIDGLNLPITAADHDLLMRDGLDMSLRTISAISAWLTSDVPWALLVGSTGRGKTLAAAWALVQSGGRYVGARELERLASARFGEEAETFSAMLATRLLVVDDIGRERDAGNMSAALLDLVDERRKRGQKTIAIANIAKAAFLKTYADARLQSRLGEPGIAVWISDSGPDLRSRKP
jgi:DNA replication protein DnaC